MKPPPPAIVALMRRRLLSWYRRSARPLPWRRDADAYRVWVAETMLQQTTVAAVLPRFERFLRRFPDLGALARAPRAAVLREWAGLGYYARAANLRAAARRIVDERGGVFPDDMDALLALPGVGRYTAAAVLSISFGRPYAVLDGNVTRILCRWQDFRRDARKPAAQRLLRTLAQDWLDARHPGDWNQAMMELGETVCTQENPRCPACPVSAFCAARKKNLQDRLPILGPRHEPKALRWTCLLMERDGQVLLWKRGAGELLLKGHWGLPEAGRIRAGLIPPQDRPARDHALPDPADGSPGPALGAGASQARWVARRRLRNYLVSSLWLKALDCRPKRPAAAPRAHAR